MILHHIPRSIQGALRLLGRHVAAEEIAKISGNSILVVRHMKMEFNRFCAELFVVDLAQIAILHHLAKHNVATLLTALRIAYRVVIGRVLTEADKCGSLIDRQVDRFLTEIRVRRGLDTDGIVQEVKIIQVHRKNLILRIVALQLDGNHPLYRFLKDTLHRGARMLRI